MTLTFGSLFSGIGGFDLGLERAGLRCAWQVEIDSYCLKVLNKHWPNVPKYGDVRNVGKHNLVPVDVICGGFPCQDVSESNTTGLGLDGDRSGLWREFHRVICELRPGYVIVENVAALLNRGIGRVLGDLAAVGYDAEWSVISACAFGAPHTRERVFIVAYPQCPQWGEGGARQCYLVNTNNGIPANGKESASLAALCYQEMDRGMWASEPGMGRVADGVPYRMDRLGGLGNAVVPLVAEWIGRRLMILDTLSER